MTLHVAMSGWLLGPPSGANRRLLALADRASALLAAGERITVLHGPEFSPPPSSRVSFRRVTIPPGPTFARARAERRVLPSVLTELGITVLDHGFLPLPRVPVPTCLLVHDVRSAVGLSRWPRCIARTILVRSCLRAAAVVAPSEWTAAQLSALTKGRVVPVVVPNGVDAAPSSDPPEGRPDHAPTPRYLLHVGHVETRKNLEVVVRALAALPPATRPQLWLAGRDAGAGARLRRLATDLGVAADVRFLGVAPEPELDALYAGASAVVVPSHHEGFGLCALEGLAHGRPVLASRAGALPEVVGAAGLLLPPDDPSAWSRAIAALEDSAALRAVRRAHAARFAWDAAAARLVESWRRVAAGQRTR